jgi:metallo-beta-lactamase class B
MLETAMTMSFSRSLAIRVASLALLGAPLFAQAQQAANLNPQLEPFPPFEIIHNLYYVGSQDQASFLIATSAGLILINSGYAASAPLIRRSVEKLGLRFADLKILLISHAHIDHAAGSAAILKMTGAKYEVMDADAPVVESGGTTDFQNGKIEAEHYEPAHVDRVLHDLDQVQLGHTLLTAHRTAGHTKGCTTWTYDEIERGRTLHILVLCGVAASAGPHGQYQLLDNPDYANIAEDFMHTFDVLPTLPCDIFLGAHGRYFRLKQKYEELKAGNREAFVDRAGYLAFVEDARQTYQKQLAQQQAEVKPPSQ